MRYGHLVIGLGVALFAGALAAGVTWAVDDPAGIMRLGVDVPEWLIDPTETDNGPASRFTLETLTGDPTTPNDDSLVVAGLNDPADPLRLTSVTSLSINNSNPQATDTLTGDLSSIQAGGGREFWPLAPTERSRDTIYRLLIPIDDTDPTQALEVIEVFAQLVLLRDTVKLDFVLTNRGTMTHNIGLRHFIDAQFGRSPLQDDGTFVTLSDGTIIDSETVLQQGVGSGIPDSWISFDSTSNPAVILKGTIKGGEVEDPGLANTSAGPPDRVEFGQRVNMGQDDQFDFTPISGFTLTGEDWGTAVRWEERALAVGASRRYVTYFGLGGSVSDFTPPYVLAGYAPFELQVVEGDDPTTPATVEEFYLGDNSGSGIWDVSAYCDNFAAGSILDARATVSLPPGFELDQSQGVQSRTILLGSIPRDNQGVARWRVRALPDIRPGVHEVRISGPLGKSVIRKISVPALPILGQDGLDPVRGLSMVSVPYSFQTTDAEHVFQSLGSLQGSDAALVRWDAQAQRYWFFPNGPSGFVTNVEPGVGYWLLNRLRLPIDFPDPPDRQPVPDTDPFPVSLDAGWNQIGSPYTRTIRFDQATVIGSDGIERTLMEAASAGLIVPTLFAYDPILNDYTYPLELEDLVMEPYVGYWFLVLRPVTLVYPTPTIIPFEAPTPTAAPEADGWRVPLIVRAGDALRTNRAFGASDAAVDGADAADIMSPPDAAAPNGAQLGAYFVRNDWGPRSGRYYTDIRQAGPKPQSWTFVVDSGAAGQPVTVSWPELGRMPANLTAMLTDLQTGQTRFMRTTGSYTFDSGQGGPRQLRISVSERGPASLQVAGFNYAPVANGVQLRCTLTAGASVDIVIRNIAGRVVKRLWDARPTPAGDTTVVWSGQAETGLTVPNGPYVVQITARSPETGEQTGVLRTIHFDR
jgi:hypothetical protein